LGLGVWVHGVMIGTSFSVFFTTSSADPMSRNYGSKFFWILGCNTNLLNPWSTF